MNTRQKLILAGHIRPDNAILFNILSSVSSCFTGPDASLLIECDRHNGQGRGYIEYKFVGDLIDWDPRLILDAIYQCLEHCDAEAAMVNGRMAGRGVNAAYTPLSQKPLRSNTYRHFNLNF